jgi:hypothetical protein
VTRKTTTVATAKPTTVHAADPFTLWMEDGRKLAASRTRVKFAIADWWVRAEAFDPKLRSEAPVRGRGVVRIHRGHPVQHRLGRPARPGLTPE